MIRSKAPRGTELKPSPGPASPGTVSVSPRNGRRLLPLVAKPSGPSGGSASTTTDITLPALHLTLYCTSRPVNQSQSQSQSQSPSPSTVNRHRLQSPLIDCEVRNYYCGCYYWWQSAPQPQCGQLWPSTVCIPSHQLHWLPSPSPRLNALSPVTCRCLCYYRHARWLALPLARTAPITCRVCPSLLARKEGPSTARRARASGPLSASRPDASNTRTPHR